MAIPLDLQRIARALGGEVRNGQILAPGPNHSRVDRSMSVRLDSAAPDGFVVNSFAGDAPLKCKDYVRQKCGLPAFGTHEEPLMAASSVAATGQPISDDMIAAALATVKTTPATPAKPLGVHTKTYDYSDADGTLLYQVLRYDYPKSFRQQRPNGDGGWIWKLGEKRVLYRLRELLKYAAGTVFICEGEKDADGLATMDLCATTVASGKWTEDCVQPLAGRDVLIMQDNDEAGARKAQHAASLLHGIAASVRVVLLPGLPPGGDVSDWFEQDSRRTKEQLIEFCFDQPVWEPGASAEPSRVSKQGGGQNNELAAICEARQPVEIVKKSEDPPPKIEFVDIGKWHKHPPPREWSTLERFPLRQVCLLSGEGAVGKSIVMLQLCAAHALGKDWLQAMPEPGAAIYLGAEDDATEIWRRMVPIAQHYGASVSELAGMFHALDFAGKNAVLASTDRRGVVQATPLFRQLREAACDIKPKLIGIDTSADVFAGEENDRSQVRQFIGLLRGLAIDANATVLVCTHPSLTGINSGTGLSGSTAWHNSVRARCYLHPTPDPELRELTFKKNNYGPIAESVRLRWKAGVFVPEPSTGSLEKLAADRKTEELFLMLLAEYADRGRNVSDKPTAPTYAPTMFIRDPGAYGVRREAFADAMHRLFHSTARYASNSTVDPHDQPPSSSSPGNRVRNYERAATVQLPVQHACSYVQLPCRPPPYTPSVLARTHARFRFACARGQPPFFFSHPAAGAGRAIRCSASSVGRLGPVT